MNTLKAIFSISTLATVLLFSTQAQALAQFGTDLNNAFPGKNLYTSCTVCHSNVSGGQDITWYSTFGNILKANGADYGFGSITLILSNIKSKDFDNDKFSLQQEVEAGTFAGGTLAGTLAFAGGTDYGTFFAKGGATESNLTATATATTTAVTTAMAVGHANRGGVIDYSFTTTQASPAAANATFLFKTGGIQASPQVFFIDNNGVTSSVAAGDISVGLDGSITVGIVDDGPFDLYSVPVLENTAVNRTFAFTPTTIFDAYANVSPYANIHPDAIVIDGATIDAYAIIDAYATIQAASTIGSYAFVGQNAVVSSIVDPYVSVSGTVATQASFNTVGTVTSRLAVTTTNPPAGLGGINGDNDNDGNEGGDSGGLHCMTTGLGTQALMFFALLGLGLLARRKTS